MRKRFSSPTKRRQYSPRSSPDSRLGILFLSLPGETLRFLVIDWIILVPREWNQPYPDVWLSLNHTLGMFRKLPSI
jgi:hypothetical protein